MVKIYLVTTLFDVTCRCVGCHNLEVCRVLPGRCNKKLSRGIREYTCWHPGVSRGSSVMFSGPAASSLFSPHDCLTCASLRIETRSGPALTFLVVRPGGFCQSREREWTWRHEPTSVDLEAGRSARDAEAIYRLVDVLCLLLCFRLLSFRRFHQSHQ